MTKKSILQKAAQKLLKENVGLKKGESVLIVTDRKNCLIFKAILDVGKILDFEFRAIKITKNRKSSSALPYLKKDFIKSDVIIGITDKSISHCPEVRLARKKFGTRVISMPGINEELFIKAMSINKEEVKNIDLKLAKKIDNCQSIRITTPSGSDLKAKVVSDAIFFEWGDSTRKGILNNVPFGEAGIAPIDIIDGEIAIDSVGSRIIPKDKVRLILKKGKIIDCNNKKAKAFVNYLKKIDGDKALKVVELSFGTNPKHKRLVNNILHDEKILGSCHIAFGGLGDKRKCKIHQDVIMLKPTVFFDKKLVIEKGKII